jgi:two-component system, LytTR family, sensor kinase
MRRVRFALVYTVVWIPVACLYVLLIFFQRGSGPGGPTISDAIGGAASTTGAAALLGLVVWRAGQRLTVGGRPLRFLAMHFGLAVLYALAWTATVAVSLVMFAPAGVAGDFLRSAGGWQTLTGVMLYGMIAGISTGVAMNRRLREEREAAQRSETLRTRAKLDALRARMDPHFLFNTLHSITALSRSEPAAVAPALERLAELLRYVLAVSADGREDVPLGDELTFVRDYLALEQLRLGTRLRVVEEIDPEALDCAIPPFTLQPLVENAIRHGISGRVEGGTLRLVARVENDLLTLEVSDDGAGAVATDALRASGIGLQAVVQRINARHRDRGSVKVVSAPGRGFAVRLSLPASASLQTAAP